MEKFPLINCKLIIAEALETNQGNYTYAVKLNSNYPTVTSAFAVVTATTAEQALRLLKSFLYMKHNNLYQLNPELSVEQVKVLAQAHDDSLGRVTLLTDGEF
jgi:hypothetical protein